ncbi:PP2C family serine/threonine-protein phosphatase [Endozoicomonas ascidiicola]|uniref:PP2C family serine/threonine-protein phosphatase n=1 Tax=Endozoicomonas ascidiicola TaxID=1698521 RepID=UPI0012FBF8ED|nr:PP2C family serine/threonine-protein phosphatase [Endozoicomonas ascidiicola]
MHSASVRGPGHINRGQPNQDAVLIRRNRNSWLAVVSDGMGSRKHSDIGSKMACQAVLMMTRQCSFDEPDKTVIHCTYKHWLNLLDNIRPDDAIATCLFAWGKPSGKCRLFQLGDGAIYVSSGEQQTLKPRDENSFGNETTGLGLSKKYSDWVCAQSQISINQGLVLVTDGISDDLVEPQLFASSVIKTMKNKGARYGKQWMKRELENWPTPHHTDDKTIAVIHRK